MTQIFTGAGLGIRDSSLGLGAYGPKGSAGLGQGGESVYLNAANGNLVLRQQDGFLADIGFGLDLVQTYNARGTGNPWVFSVQSGLEWTGTPNTVGSSITRIGEDGHRSVFLYDAQKQGYFPQGGGTAHIKFQQGNWIYQEGHQKTSYCYNASGLLTEIRDVDGHSLVLNYQNNQLESLIDNSGKQSIHWSFRNGLVQEVTTISDGVVVHHLHYEYDAQQRLQRVSRDLGSGTLYWISYEYVGDTHLISQIRQSDGTLLQIDYDAQCRVRQLTDGTGRVSRYTYDQGSTTCTNSLGESWVYYYDTDNKLTGIDGPEGYRIRYYYEGALVSRITLGSSSFFFQYNDAGDCIRIEEPSGLITLRDYDTEHRLLAETQYSLIEGTAAAHTTRYRYDALGHLRFKIAADGSVTECRYDEQGLLLSTRTYKQAAHFSEASSTKLEDLESWVLQQNPQQVYLIDYRYDWRGQLTETFHYGQVDAAGQGIVSSASIIRSRYNAAGQLVELSKPLDEGFSTTHYVYDDLGRLLQTLDNQNHSQRFEYDDAHHRIIQTDANGLQTIQLLDGSGLVLSVLRLDAQTHYGTKYYQYDAQGRLIVQTDEEGRSLYTFYDAQGRVRAQIDAGGVVTETLYNDEGLVIQTRQYAQRVDKNNLRGQYPDWMAIKPTPSTQDHINQLIYNARNQLAYRIDAQGAVVAYEYNAQNQLKASTAYATKLSAFNPQKQYTYESIALEASTKDRMHAYYYDALGRLEAEVNAEGYATHYSYDRLGNLIETCRFLTPCTYTGDWSLDKPIANRSDIYTYSLYDGRGLKIADIDGAGYLTEYRYDARNLLIEQCVYEEALSSRLLINETTTLDQIRPQEGKNDRHTYYQYNDLEQLVEEHRYSGLISSSEYDASGHLIRHTARDASTQAVREQKYRYDALGRVIQSLDATGAALLAQHPQATSEEKELIWQAHSTHFEYDNSGLLLSTTNALKQRISYFYDESQALRFSVDADGAVIEYTYNAFGELIQTQAFSTYLKKDIQGLTTEALAQQTATLHNATLDEVKRYEYNEMGQMITLYKGSHSTLLKRYNAFGELAWEEQSIAEHNTTVTTYEYDKRGLRTQQVQDAQGLAQEHSTVYDAFGWVIEIRNAHQTTQAYELNRRGEVIRQFNAAHQSKHFTYDAYGRILYETDYTNTLVVKSFIYDDTKQRMTLKNTLGQIVTEFNAFGDKIRIVDANKTVTEFFYNEQGLLSKTQAPEQSSMEYQYDAAGNLIWQQNAGGQTTTYSYNAAARILSKTEDPQGMNLTTTYTYDALGRTLQITDAQGIIKEFRYDNAGNLVQSCMDPQGLALVSEWVYDDRGLLLRQIERNTQGLDKVTAYEWDSLGRKVAQIIDPEGLGISTGYEYDAQDRIISVTDANQHRTHYTYDVDNRCRFELNSRGVLTEHVYDINGNERRTIRYAQPLPSLEIYDEAHIRAALHEDPLHDVYQFRMFNATGQVVNAYDALGYATTYQYDGNGNITSLRRCALPVSLEMLKEGKYPFPSSEDARIEYFVYDGLNQLRFRCDTEGRIKEVRYDKNGQILQSTEYATPLIFQNYLQLTMTYIVSHLKPSAESDKTTRYQYDKAGRVALELSAEGVLKSYDYDALGKVLATTLYATRLSEAAWDRVTTEGLPKSAQDRVSHYVYDAAGRERYRISSEGRVVERRYDALGNVLILLP